MATNTWCNDKAGLGMGLYVVLYSSHSYQRDLAIPLVGCATQWITFVFYADPSVKMCFHTGCDYSLCFLHKHLKFDGSPFIQTGKTNNPENG